MWKLLLLIAFLCGKGDSNQCAPRTVNIGAIVCVCNATYCDTTPEKDPKVPKEGEFYWYVTSKDGLRLDFFGGEFGTCSPLDIFKTVLVVNTSDRYQSILGYGGAFTDSAGINIRKLSNATQDKLLRSYFDKDGSRYTLGRIPIAGTDFSTRPYTYDDYPNDDTLKHFALANEDYQYKIPYARRAKELSPEIKFFSAAWSAPAWMKNNDNVRGFLDFLKPQYYQLFADYILKFMDEYKKNGIDIWAVSTGNEPIDAYVPALTINDMGWTPDSVATWVAENLGPTLARSSHNGTKIICLDDQRIEVPLVVQLIFKNEKAKKYIDGIGIHIYSDSFAPPELLDQTHFDYPDKFILMTEASLGAESITKVSLGSWERGQMYMDSILQYMNHWTVGWVDWSIALDETGGPTWVHNNIDSPIIVIPENDEFYKQPMYYAIKHFSRFVPRGSVRVSVTDSLTVKTSAFVTPSNEVVVVLHNRNIVPETISLEDSKKGPICLVLPALSMNTVIYAL